MNKEQFSNQNTLSIRKITLTTREGTEYDVKSMLVEMSIYSSIFSPTMSGVIVLVDAMNTVSNFPIIGGEVIEVEWTTAGLDRYQSVKMRVAGVGERVMEGQKSAFKLPLVSEARYVDVVKRYSRGWTAQYSTIVKDCVEYIGGVFANFEESSGIVTYASPAWTPLDVAEWARSRAHDAKLMPMLLWEDIDGFNFVSLNSLLKGEVRMKLIQSPQGLETQGDKILNTVREIEFGESRDLMTQRYTGVMNHHENIYDFTNKRTQTLERTYDDFFNRTNSLEDGKVFNSPQNKYASEVKVSRIARPDNSHIAVDTKNTASNMLSNSNVSVSTFGDSTARSGDVVEFNILSPQPLPDGQPRFENLISGKQLVSGVRHILRPGTYMMARELLKDSYNESVTESSYD